MKSKKNRFYNLILILFVFILSCLAVFLFFLIVKKINDRKIYVSRLDKSNFTHPKDSSLRYFYYLAPKLNLKDKNIHWLPPGRETIQQINKDGINNLTDYEVKKPNGVFRIIALGDSFTYGSFINTENNYPSRLESKLNSPDGCPEKYKFEVLNFGVPGYDLEYAIELFKLKGQKYNPDLILWFIKNDDFMAISEHTIPREKQLEIDKNIKVNSPEYFFSGDVAYPLWQYASNDLINDWGEKKITQYQVTTLMKISDVHKGKLIFFTFPSLEEKYKNIIRNIVSTNRNYYFYENLVDIYGRGAFLPDKHPNEIGYDLITDDLISYLNHLNVFPCEMKF